MSNQVAPSLLGPSGSKVPRNANHVQAIRTALQGILYCAVSEPNFRIHCLATAVVASAAIWFRVSNTEAVLLTFACVMVLSAEMINTTLEHIVNLVSPEWHEDARVAKDAAAGMVLVMSVGALLCGVLVFGPHIW